MIEFVIFFACMALLVWSFIYENRVFKRKAAENKKKSEEFLEAQKNIVGIVRFTDHNDVVHETSTFKATTEVLWREELYCYPGISWANEHLRECYKRGFFRNKEGRTFPSCNVHSAWVEEVEK